jgi:SMC interacting uncharacterized protein involved in chromosome segregation
LARNYAKKAAAYSDYGPLLRDVADYAATYHDLGKLADANRKLELQKKENEKLEEELKSTRKKMATLEKDFNKSKNFAKIVTSKLTPTGGMSELRRSVERYITEIDKCIETLEKTL